MRITCTVTPFGNEYRFYRVGNDFSRTLKPLIPLLLASGGDITVGSDDAASEPGLLLSVVRMSADAEAKLRKRVEKYLSDTPPRDTN